MPNQSQPAAAPGIVESSAKWEAPEYIAHPHPFSWYFLLLVATAILAGLIYFVAHDIFAVIIIGLLGLVVAVAAGRRPKIVSYELSATGLQVGAKNYPYRVFKSFWVSGEGDTGIITLEPLKRLMPPVAVYFPENLSQHIVETLSAHLPHNETGEDYVERLAHRLHF